MRSAQSVVLYARCGYGIPHPHHVEWQRLLRVDCSPQRSTTLSPRHAWYVLYDLGGREGEDREHGLNQREARRSVADIANTANFTSVVATEPFVRIVEVVVKAEPGVGVQIARTGPVTCE